MHKLSKILKITVKINLEVNVADMTKNKLENKILHTKIRSRHASNPLKYGCVTGHIKIITLGSYMHQLNDLLKINVKISL